VTGTSSNIRIDHREVTTRSNTARHMVARLSTAILALADIWQYIDAALADAPTLSAEVTRLRAELDDMRLDRANLLAAARATIGAYLDGESDPLCYLRDELAARGQLPPNERDYR
jgi:predicted DNA-binding ribbon-helix-helix protein